MLVRDERKKLSVQMKIKSIESHGVVTVAIAIAVAIAAVLAFVVPFFARKTNFQSYNFHLM